MLFLASSFNFFLFILFFRFCFAIEKVRNYFFKGIFALLYIWKKKKEACDLFIWYIEANIVSFVCQTLIDRFYLFRIRTRVKPVDGRYLITIIKPFFNEATLQQNVTKVVTSRDITWSGTRCENILRVTTIDSYRQLLRNCLTWKKTTIPPIAKVFQAMAAQWPERIDWQC